QLAGGIPIPLPHRWENQFQPDLDELETLLLVHQPKYVLVNFPCNPTSATCSRKVMTEMVNLARKHRTILVADNAYSEMYFDKEDKPLSFLEIPGAKEVTIEFHSLSKTFNMTGWRIAFAVGNQELIAGLLRVKTNIDSGPLLAVQKAAEFALANADRLAQPIRELYFKRREIVLNEMKRLGIEYFHPKATFFVWARVPGKESSMDFTKRLISKHGLVVTPGIGFGEHGEGFFRLALTVPNEKLLDAMSRLEKALRN
ncbi:aminotransferase class I/II-fold pyridoxal phosphate-dependent enzyme, partial [bacterium]|nr:aminotransferase class I/II-fold pyridoxal phosphate-dependent enzyme [bacterium]